MDLQETIRINRAIMALIRQKYDQFFPGAYSTPESRYYTMLERDTIKAVSALKHGGIDVPPQEP